MFAVNKTPYPRTHADIMTPRQKTRTMTTLSRMLVSWAYSTATFLWVRRFRLDRTFKGGFKRKHLHRIEFLPESDPTAYGSHLIPAFAYGPTEPVPYTSLARKPDEFDDWRYHYVNFFVDRDMFMRYLGGGVGHYQVKVPDEDADGPGLPDDDGDDAEQPDPHLAHTPDASDVESEAEEDGPPEGSQEEIDEGDDESGDEEEEEEEEEDGDFGPEDGENREDDLTVQLGYDEL
ncbi:hypothetical protein B0H13DRAFT_2387735 [Mycena leptocephala]|nr:hypothetical protein B0H13DRAFT_2387735 [Mycena leptocephala]